MANIYSTPSNYWIKPGAFTVSLNALDNPQYLQASVLSGAVIMAYKEGIIEYDSSHNYRKWNLEAYNTFFDSTSAKHVYARLDSKEDSNQALIVYSSDKLDINGKRESDRGSMEGSSYFFLYLGSIAASVNDRGDSIPRVWKESFNYGKLATDQSIREESKTELEKMFRLNGITGMIDVLKTINEATINIIRVGKKLVFGEKEIVDVKRSIDSEDDVHVGDDNLATSKYVEKAIEELSISSKNDDTAAGLITFLQGLVSKDLIKADAGLEVGEFIDSLTAGKGTGLFPNGKIQAESLELRSSLTVLELIFNRLSAQEGDTSFSESGVIESIELLEDGTYRLPLRKRWDTDFTAFDWNDIIYGSVNDLATGGGNYRTSWMRVLGVNTADNYIEAVLYPDSEVPGGKNYPPEPLMAITRRGNTSDEKRQSYWYISSYEKCICMLDGVTKPILEENNYSILIGKMKNLAIFDHLPINYRQSYIYCRGLIGQDIIKVDVNGKPIYELTNRGIWSLAVAQSANPYLFQAINETTGLHETSTVYHRGSKWQCLKSGTLLEPKWNSTDWAFLEGNGEFSIDFESSKGFSFFYGLIDTIIEAHFFHGTVDVTEDVMNTPGTVITWKRDTGIAAEDNAWSPSFVDGQKNKIHLISSDMGSEWLNARSITFKINAVIPLGEENYLRESEELQFNL